MALALALRRRAQPRLRQCAQRREVSSGTPPWRSSAALDEWVKKEARPISLRQLTFFSRSITESRLLTSANYVRTELPTRLAHRLRDMQTLPFAVVSNPHITHVYELYYRAFEAFRRVKEIKTVEANKEYCKIIADTLKEHLSVIPQLTMGILECQELMEPEDLDKFMNTLLRSRISRRVIAELHLALTEAFSAIDPVVEATKAADPNVEVVGQILLRCNARDLLERCGRIAQTVVQKGGQRRVPEIRLQGHLDASFPYVLSHVEYIIGELLRNSIQAVAEYHGQDKELPPVEVLVCEAAQHVIFRVSDQGGGIPRDVMPYIWSFSKGSRRQAILDNLLRVPKMAATMHEVEDPAEGVDSRQLNSSLSSLGSLTSRPPNLKLGIGLPMSRVYAEYWAGNIELHSLEGYGVDVFLQIPKLGNTNEQLTTRASMDAI